MKQAIKMYQEILRKQTAIYTTTSKNLKNDYSKSIDNDLKKLKRYCTYKGLNYDKIVREVYVKEN